MCRHLMCNIGLDLTLQDIIIVWHLYYYQTIEKMTVKNSYGQLLTNSYLCGITVCW